MNEYGNSGQFTGGMQQAPVVPQQSIRAQVKPVNGDEPMNITSLADLQSYAAGTVVRFPDFA